MDGLRRIWLCADDYGIAPGVNAAIRDLIERRRINAASVMMVAPHIDRSEALALGRLASPVSGVAIGLHLTLTAPFRPLSERFRPLQEGRFLPLGRAVAAAMFRRYRGEALRSEIAAQVAAYRSAFGRAPDFIDGHQHIHLFPQIRDAVLSVAAAEAPNAWLRQCGRLPQMRRRGDRKGLVLDRLSAGFRRLAERRRIATNPAFAGTYDFHAGLDFAALFPSFIDRMPDGGVVMCHPGRPDAELARLDTLTTGRQREYDFFLGEEFPRMLKAHGVTLV